MSALTSFIDSIVADVAKWMSLVTVHAARIVPLLPWESISYTPSVYMYCWLVHLSFRYQLNGFVTSNNLMLMYNDMEASHHLL
jgi:hypothetical protein